MEFGSDKVYMRLRIAILHYLVCGLIFNGLILIAIKVKPELFVTLAWVMYIICGVHLNRNVLRKLVTWHPVYATVVNVSSAKLSYFIFWPIKYLVLFIRLAVIKVL